LKELASKTLKFNEVKNGASWQALVTVIEI